MSKVEKIQVTTKDGIHGTADVREAPEQDGNQQILVQMDNGQQFYIPFNLLQHEKGSHYYAPFSLAQIESISAQSGRAQTGENQHLLVIPVIAEELNVHKKQVETGRVRLTKKVREHDEEIRQDLAHEEVKVERVPVNRYIEEPAEVHQEGDTLVIPVMEEEVVVEKRLRLKEEIRVTRQKKIEPKTETVTLREEEVQVDRIEPQDRGA